MRNQPSCVERPLVGKARRPRPRVAPAHRRQPRHPVSAAHGTGVAALAGREVLRERQPAGRRPAALAIGVPGVLRSRNVRSDPARQVTTSSGEGAAIALTVHEHLCRLALSTHSR